MLQYLIVLLDDTSISFCHYENERIERKLIILSDLEKVILFSLKENLSLQFVYPDYALPKGYNALIESVPHTKIVSSSTIKGRSGNIVIIDGWKNWECILFDETVIYVLRTSKDDFFNYYHLVVGLLERVIRLNIIITDIETFVEEDFENYERVLAVLSNDIENLYLKAKMPQFNLLTDRMMLEKMNNCNAGWESITIAPNGKFYVCPAFYLENEANTIGDLTFGLNIKNAQLYKLGYAPICRNCDAYQCKRCIYLNHKNTLEMNTPSHEQCVVAHLERNASRLLLMDIRRYGEFLPNHEIEDISYLDPFDVRKSFKF